jgi:tRNA pseudouridine55 synthase
MKKVGHGGTLDPAVTGVLPIAVGPATRLLPYLSGEKCYEGVIQLGVTTSTDDLEGCILEEAPLPAGLGRAEVDAALGAFRGSIMQAPPAVSAVKIDGVRAYKRARRGEHFAPRPRQVLVSELELLSWDAASGKVGVRVRCGAGTYIRSLARDLGAALGCGGALRELRRTAALGFTLADSDPFSCLEIPSEDRDAGEGAAPPPPPPRVVSPLVALRHLPHRQLADSELRTWLCGGLLKLKEPNTLAPADQPYVVVRPGGELAGIAKLTACSRKLQPKVVIHRSQ